MPRKVVIVMNFLEKFITIRPKSRIFDEIEKVYSLCDVIFYDKPKGSTTRGNQFCP